jgi:hypothetical protein
MISDRSIPQVRKYIRSRTPLRKQQEQIYSERRKIFLRNHPWCAVAEALHEKPRRATQVHHRQGRIGRLLLDERHWLPVSMFGHEWINCHPKEARALKLLCELGKWNTYEA